MVKNNASITGLSFDLAEFARQKAELQQKATAHAASIIEEIKQKLVELKTLVQVSDIPVYVSGLKYNIEEVEELHPDWNSSSYNC